MKVFQILFGPIIGIKDLFKNYDYTTHLGLFLMYNIPWIVITVMILLLIVIGVTPVNNWAESIFIDYWIKGNLMDNVYAWKIHLVINALIYLFVGFKKE